MGVRTKVGNLLSPKDPELVQKTLAWIDEQNRWNDVFSTKLIELLDNIDLLKREHTRRLRDIEVLTKQATASFERAQEKARLSEQKHTDSVRVLGTVVRLAVWGTVFSWIAVIWLAWFAMQGRMPLWMACTASSILCAAAVLLSRRVAT